ncbi:MAG: hypothetical protein FWC68_01480 [Oscillospiraceae bacterium]|nr:hypothetical protein [Oscillospiraceae bacterium]
MKGKNLLIGLFFILAAGLFIANELGYLAEISTFQLAAVVFLIPVIAISVAKLYFVGIFFPLAGLAVIFSEKLGITEYTEGFPIWIVALCLTIGVSLIFGKNLTDMWTESIIGTEEVISEEGDEFINHGVTLGSSIKYVNSKELKNAKLSTTLGELTVYFDNAEVSPGGATIRVNAVLSDLVLYIPKGWTVQNDIGSILSDVTERRAKQEDGTINVRLVGKAVLSDVSIICV